MLIDFQQKILTNDLSEETKLLTETFHGMVMKGQMEINEKSPNDWHLRLNLSEYSETIKEFVFPIIPGYHLPEKDILHCSLVHGKDIIIIIIICVCLVDGLSISRKYSSPSILQSMD